MALGRMMFLVCSLLVAFVSAQQRCRDTPLGAENGKLRDDQFVASTEYNRFHGAKYARLNAPNGNAWCAKVSDSSKPYIKVVLDREYNVYAVAVQGREHKKYSGWYPTRFAINYHYKNDFSESYSQIKVADGPQNDTETVKVNFAPVKTTEVMIMPINWYPQDDFVCLRLELYGCPVPHNPCKGSTCENCKVENNKAICYCDQGYQLHTDGKSCVDVDECALGKCDLTTSYCFNSKGTFHCQCHSGMEKKNKGDTTCVDKNECALGRWFHGCTQGCKNLERSYKCFCNDGYRLAADNKTCVDVNECTEKLDKCDTNTTACKNEKGTYSCQCLSGLEYKTGDNKRQSCVDIDECAAGAVGDVRCQHICENNYRSYECKCRKGFQLYQDGRSCNDIDECKTLTNPCGQHEECENTVATPQNPKGFKCVCKSGYEKDTATGKCVDIDECAPANKQCSHGCKNTDGSFECSCPAGYVLEKKVFCRDQDECALDLDNCDKGTSDCINTQGSFECRCKPGYDKNLKTGNCEAIKCGPLNAPTNGFVEPQDCYRDKARQFGEACLYKCNPGFELEVHSARDAFCNEHGQWDFRGKFEAKCVPIHCPKIALSTDMRVAPSTCASEGGEYNKDCQIYCINGATLTGGVSRVLCQKDGTYTPSLNNNMKCLAVKKLECPNDITLKLPLGSESMSLPLEKLSKKLDVSKLTSEPSGVLTGHYRFKSSSQSHRVKLTQSTQYSSSSCEFYVTVEDKEAPVVENCPEKVYVKLNSPNGIVSWNKPVFKDNVGITKEFVNLKNSAYRGEQVYYVYYAASDEFQNEAVCRFFVHVTAEYCDKNNLPGADGAASTFFIGANPSLRVLITCPPTAVLAFNNTSPANIFECKNNQWGFVPDCVDKIQKTGASCPAGHNIIKPNPHFPEVCAKCPKGTIEVKGQCVKCPKGSYNDQIGAVKCKQCPQGTTTQNDGQKDVSGCQAMCDEGEYSKNGLKGTNGCLSCPEGSFQNVKGQQQCKICPATGLSNKGSKAESDCKVVPARIVSFNSTATFKQGGDFHINCIAIGNPAPRVDIKSTQQLGDASKRGTATRKSIATGKSFIVHRQLTIAGATDEDIAVYECVANNVNGSLGGKDTRECPTEML